MAEITPFTVTIAGGKPTFAAAASGDTAKVGPGYTLIVKNTNAATRTVTIAYPGTLPSGDAIPDKVYTIGATTGEEWIPLLSEYADPTSGQAVLTWSATADVTRAVVKR